jgi:maltose O-acetyltransferase
MRTLVHMTTQARDGDARTMRERMLAGDLYVFDDPELGEANAAALDLMAAYNGQRCRRSETPLVSYARSRSRDRGRAS